MDSLLSFQQDFFIFIKYNLLWIGFVLTIFAHFALYYGGFEFRKATTYTCFFFAGITVAELQWQLFFEGEIILYYLVAMICVPIANLIGILLYLIYYLKEDKLLSLLVRMTLLLWLMQTLAEIDMVPSTVLNLYALIYAATAMVLPFISLRRERDARGL